MGAPAAGVETEIWKSLTRPAAQSGILADGRGAAVGLEAAWRASGGQDRIAILPVVVGRTPGKVAVVAAKGGESTHIALAARTHANRPQAACVARTFADVVSPNRIAAARADEGPRGRALSAEGSEYRALHGVPHASGKRQQHPRHAHASWRWRHAHASWRWRRRERRRHAHAP